jgi:hypothetical protein
MQHVINIVIDIQAPITTVPFAKAHQDFKHNIAEYVQEQIIKLEGSDTKSEVQALLIDTYDCIIPLGYALTKI